MLVLLSTPGWAGWSPEGRKAQRAYNDAVAQLQGGDPAAAEAQLRAVLDIDPTSGQAHHALGVALLRQNRAADAFTQMQSVAADFPEVADAQTGLSNAAFATQDFALARAAGARAVALAPDSLEAVTALLSAQLRDGLIDGARQTVADARGQIDGPSLSCLEAQVHLEAGDVSDAERLLPYCQRSVHPELAGAIQSALGTDRQRAQVADQVGADRAAKLNRAAELLNRGDAAGAKAVLDPLVAAVPERADARLLRARAVHELGDDAAALIDLEAAFQGDAWVDVHQTGAMSGVLLKSHERALDAAMAEGAGLMVELLVKSGDVSQAQAQLDRAIQALGERAPLAAAQARLAFARGEIDAGWSMVNAGLSRWPTSHTLMNLAGEQGLAAPQSFQGAAAMRASPRWSDRYNLALIYLKRAEMDACIETVDTAQDTSGDARVLQRFWAVGYHCAVKATDRGAADRYWSRTMDRSTLGEIDRVNHALYRYQSGDFTGALDILEDLDGEDAVRKQAAAIAQRICVDGNAPDRCPRVLERLDGAQ
ncbi:MAG: tetratricopeptide repeat protein [Myxococcota bacterium]